MKTKAVIYCRFSPRPGADECQSNAVQLAACKRYCRRMGYQLAGKFADESQIFNECGRGMAEAIEAAKRGWVVVIAGSSIVGDTVLLTEHFYESVRDKGARVEAVTGVHGWEPDEAMMRQVAAAYSEYGAKKAGVPMDHDSLERALEVQFRL